MGRRNDGEELVVSESEVNGGHHVCWVSSGKTKQAMDPVLSMDTGEKTLHIGVAPDGNSELDTETSGPQNCMWRNLRELENDDAACGRADAIV
jgi:hypothetical protein